MLIAPAQYYLTLWYCRHEIQLRQAMFFSAASIAGAFSGLLAFGISKMDGVGGLEGWRWIFILEGIVTVLVAFCAFFLIYDFPDTAPFLTEEERDFVVRRLRYQGQTPVTVGEDIQGGAATPEQIQVGEADEFQWKYVRQAFADWQIWVNIFVYWGVSAMPLARIPSCPLAILSWPLHARTWQIAHFRLDRLSALCTASAFSCLRSSRTWATNRVPRSS